MSLSGPRTCGCNPEPGPVLSPCPLPHRPQIARLIRPSSVSVGEAAPAEVPLPSLPHSLPGVRLTPCAGPGRATVGRLKGAVSGLRAGRRRWRDRTSWTGASAGQWTRVTGQGHRTGHWTVDRTLDSEQGWRSVAGHSAEPVPLGKRTGLRERLSLVSVSSVVR